VVSVGAARLPPTYARARRSLKLSAYDSAEKTIITSPFLPLGMVMDVAMPGKLVQGSPS